MKPSSFAHFFLAGLILLSLTSPLKILGSSTLAGLGYPLKFYDLVCQPHALVFGGGCTPPTWHFTNLLLDFIFWIILSFLAIAVYSLFTHRGNK